MRPTDDIKQFVKNTKIKTNPAVNDAVLADLIDRLESAKDVNQSPQSNIWRTIMKSKITRLTTAAMITIATVVGLYMPSTAYALEQTIKAYNSIRWLHIFEYETQDQETPASEIWLQCNQYGKITQMRLQSEDAGEPVGPLTIIGNVDHSQAWLPKHNLQLTGYGDPSVLLSYNVSELDPVFLFERLLEQENRNEAIVDISKPDKKSDPIIVTVTYPQGSRSENWKKVFTIDPATKLVIKIDKYQRKDQEFQHVKSLEFFDYNQPIDPAMFTLDGDVSKDAKIIDMSQVEAGLAQGDKTNEQAVSEVIRKFFEAVIEKDFSKAGQYYLAAPDFLVEQGFMGANVLEILSVGRAYPDPDPDSDKMLGSCKVLAEFDGKYYEINASVVNVIPVENANRWLICGMSVNVYPAESGSSQ